MKLPGTTWFWTAAAILVTVVVCLVPGQARAEWSYEYRDEFNTNKAESDSYLHSIFWPQGAF
ncbi:MAG: hypothetical protein ACYTGS_15195, partial [Planctomycetota bacterium]